MSSDPCPNRPPRLTRTEFPIGPGYVVVARRALYWQGILLGVVATGGFVLGILVGRDGAPSGRTDIAAISPPCTLNLRVSFLNREQTAFPDAGAVAIALPQTNPPDSKIAFDGLRPAEPLPATDHPAWAAIRSLGGNYARADEQGQMQLRVSAAGRYYVLVMSAHQAHRQVVPARHVLAALGRYFLLTPDLFAGCGYRWREETIPGERELNIVFQDLR